jgi:hypothetical protein
MLTFACRGIAVPLAALVLGGVALFLQLLGATCSSSSSSRVTAYQEWGKTGTASATALIMLNTQYRHASAACLETYLHLPVITEQVPEQH